MGRYGEAVKRANDSIFIQLEPGVKTRLRILDDPYAQNTTFIQKDGTPGNPRTTFSWPVWDYEAGKIRVLSKGASVLKQIDAITDAWNIEDMPMECDIIIEQTGTGLNTRYEVQGAPRTEGLPQGWEAQMPDMDKLIQNGVSLKDYASGAKLNAVAKGNSNDGDDNHEDPFAGMNLDSPGINF